MPRALFLCSGTGSVGEPFRLANWEVTDVDWDGIYGAEVQCDTMTWDCNAAFPTGHFDVIWSSPDCTMYSLARTTAKTPRNFAKADALVQKCLEIIDFYQPRLWFLENPDTGYLKSRPFMQNVPYVRVDYCMYGTDYRKRTRIWTNAHWKPQLCDRSHCIPTQGARCITYRHIACAQRIYPKTRREEEIAAGRIPQSRNFTRYELHRLPRTLCNDIFAQANAAV